LKQLNSEIRVDADTLQALQQQYVQDAMALLQKGFFSPALSAGSLATGTAPQPDKRFADAAWANNPVASYAAAVYQLNARAMMDMAEAVVAEPKTRSRIRFAVEQYLAASAPSNFLALNAEALKKAMDTQGQSIARGLQNMLKDIRQGHVSMTDESQFELGKNLATTEGTVVYENAFFQLIEYKPLTDQVYAKPFLLVPPCINKYYILDLQPENSLVRYAVAQGHRTFMVSWRNPDETLAHATWDDYIEHAVLQAIAVVQDICKAPAINALGFCVGGTMLATALGVLAARYPGKELPVASATLLTTFLDFSDTGILDIFIDEDSVKYREQEMAQGGLMKGSDLSSTFSFLRPNDLVWNYVVGNYLKGEIPPPFDLLYWNSDSTNLPGPYYAWYLRNTYLENNLAKPARLTVCGEKLDLRKIKIPVYLYGSREDHIVPIGSAYASTQVLTGPLRFVQGASGHIAGVINPPVKNKRSHWIRADGKLPATYAQWLVGATEHPGSWWTDWAAWLQTHAGTQIAAPKTYGNRKYKALHSAPGTYVKVRV
jgi:polyhydroxyalkanoate synthase subunit PhaC